jgi:hypothetical protein
VFQRGGEFRLLNEALLAEHFSFEEDRNWEIRDRPFIRRQTYDESRSTESTFLTKSRTKYEAVSTSNRSGGVAICREI